MDGSPPLAYSLKNEWKREPVRVALQYALTILSALLAGWMLPHFFTDSFWQKAADTVSMHFSSPYAEATGVREIFWDVVVLFRPVLACLITVAVFSFSSLSYLATDGALIYLGMRSGCTASILAHLFKGLPSLSYRPSLLCLFLFLLFKLLLILIFCSYSLRMARYSYQLRKYSAEGRAIPQPRVLLALLLRFFQCTAVLLALHVLYGCSIYFVSK